MTQTPGFGIQPFGEAAVIVILGNSIDEANYRQLAALAKAIQEKPPLGFCELVPAYNSLLVVFDPLLSDTTAIASSLQALASAMEPVSSEAAKDIIELPVAYGGNYGPDLDTVATKTGLTPDEVIAIHSSKPYLVYMLGFTPGFPYLGGMDPRIAASRLKTPRTKVPAGSVGIADAQTGVYPLESPGGWNLIGRTPLALFDPARQVPALLAPGSYVRFVPISHEQFDALQSQREVTPDDERTMDDSAPVPAPVKAPESAGGSAVSTTLLVLKPGALSTVQDTGRFGFQAAGVPPSGPMDEYSMSLANILAGNEPGSACIECTLGGLELRFEAATMFALAGADTPAFLDDQAVAMHRSLRARAGAVLRLGMAKTGLRMYFAVNGGIAVPMVMGSRATFQRGGFGGLDGRALAAGDRLVLGQSSDSAITDRIVPQALIPASSSSIIVRAIPSHEADRFTIASLERFFSASYAVSQKSDRMGCRLEGPTIEHSSGADIISSGVQTGTVQVPGDGQPIVLMADRQTTGGYTRIAQVIRADLPLLGQARPGDTVRFVRCTTAEAARALAMQHQILQQVQTGVLKAVPTPARNRGAQSAGTRHFRVDIQGQSFIVILEEC
ncbi:MAG: 5-oxoprolinase subunit PxpB [Clostridia bacterium]